MRQLVVLVLVMLAAGEVPAGTKDARIDSLYREAMARVGQVPPQVSIESFEQVLKLDWEFAPAHYEIARLYMEMNTPLTRQSARKALKQAMRLDPENTDYQMTLGELFSRQGFWWHAVRHYGKLAETEPENAEASYWAGYYAAQDYLRYIDRQDPFIYVDKDLGRMFYWKNFALQDLERARTHFRESIDADPGLRGPYYQLGLLHYETGQPKEMILVFKRFLEQAPEDKDAFMFCGLGYQMLGDMDAADSYYTLVLERMSNEERAMIEAVDILASAEDRKRMAEAIAYADNGGDEWPDVARDRFWRRHDPLFLTSFNERKMAHFGRVAYANLRYSRPFKEIAGWRTDTGKTFIKFGRYIKRVSTGRAKTWFYETFSISFNSSDGMDGWRFGLGKAGGGTIGRQLADVRVTDGRDMYNVTQWRDDLGDFYSGKNRMVLQNRPSPPSRHVFRDTPQRFIDPYRDRKYRIPRQIAAFQERDSVRVEFAYAIPKSRVRVNEPEGLLDLEDGVFLFDEQWDEVYRKTMDVTMHWPEFDNAPETKSDSLRRNHMVSYRTLRVAPRRHRLVVEVRDRGSGTIGTFRELRTFGSHDSSLSMSDLLLASRIRPRTAFPEGRDDLLVTPNPLHTFGRSEPVFLYLEIYNLKKDRFGRTKYRISYRLTRPDREEIHPERFAALEAPGAAARVEVQTIIEEPVIASEDDLWRDGIQESVRYRVKYILPERNRISEEIENTPRSLEGTETTVTARYEGDRTDDFTFLQIESNDTPAGFHKLIVAVKDLYTGQIAKRHVVYRVVE